MLRLIALVISIGLADSINPTTIGAALYLAAEQRGRGRVAEFTFAVFAVYLLGGAGIALGPGQLVLSAFSPRRVTTNILEIVAGTALLGVAVFLLWQRQSLSERELRTTDLHARSGAILGATITAVELPTAFPYFAAIAAIVASGVDATTQLGLLVLFNVCFVLPLVGIVALLAVAGDGAAAGLARSREALHRHWPGVAAGVALLVGVVAVLLGISGLSDHSSFASVIQGRLFLRHLG